MTWVASIVLFFAVAPLFTSSGQEVLAVAFDTASGIVGLLGGMSCLTVAAALVMTASARSPLGRAFIRVIIAIPYAAALFGLFQAGSFRIAFGILFLVVAPLTICWSTKIVGKKRFFESATALSIFVIMISALEPTWVGSVFQAAGTMFLLLASWLVLLGFLNRVGYLRLVVLIAAIGFMLTSLLFRTHDLRLLADSALFSDIRSTDCPNVPTEGGLAVLKDVLDCWVGKHADADGQATMILVATAGGGARAAEWTADVLAYLDHKVPGFSSHLFAISSVSGGSVGAATYVAALRERESGRRCVRSEDVNDLRPCVRLALQGNALGALIAAWLSSDIISSVFGPASYVLDDRAAALEKGWEHAWGRAYGDNLLGESFGALFRTHPWPALYINATSVGTGDITLFSSARSFYGLGAFDDRDPTEYATPQMRTSTVIGASARFAFVSPAASLAVPDVYDKAGDSVKLSDKQSQRTRQLKPKYVDTIVDGGYSDNFGGVTLHRIITSIDAYQCERLREGDEKNRELQCPDLLRSQRFIRYVVIQISSDPTITQWDCQAPPLSPGLVASSSLAQWNFIVPFVTLDNARQYNGIIYSAVLQEYIQQLYDQDEHVRVFDAPKKEVTQLLGPYFHFGLGRLEADSGKQTERVPSLNWVLSESTRKQIEKHLNQCVEPSAPAISEILRIGMYYKPLSSSAASHKLFH